jgi:hypothetical protein
VKQESFTQLLLVIVIVGVIVLTAVGKPLPGPLLLVLGVLCPSPAQVANALAAKQ